MDNNNDTPTENNDGIINPPPPPTLPPLKNGEIRVNIEEDMKDSYIDYAMSVIVGRALPDVRDGLKPVHRRVLYAMFDQGFTSKKPFVKSARTVGEVLGKYHPHGDTAVYDTLVRMAQSFSLRYPLINGHGNFGSIDGDSAAAMRYTEARLHSLAEELLRDIDMDTIDWMPNFDGSLNEPTVLPSKFPNLLVNGSSGIAVGMATNMPPHNLNEITNGMVHLIDNPDASIDDLMEHIPGPDFPTGGIIMGRDGIESAFKTGRGRVVVRAVVDIEEFNKGRDRIVVKELPYQVNKARLVKSIADLVKDKKIDGITDLRDESSREGMRVCIELRKGVNTDVILNQLYKHTQMQSSFGVINLVLVDNRPHVLDLKSLMENYISHCKEIIRRRTEFRLRKAEAKAHILEGLTIALDNLDDVIQLIKSAKSPSDAKIGLMETFMLSEKQAQAILDMKLQRLTGLERDKIIADYHETLALIEQLKGILSSELKIREIIKDELSEIQAKYGDDRRSKIVDATPDRIDIEDLMQEEDIIITVTKNGYIKRMSPAAFTQINRGGKGSSVMGVKEDDVVEHMFLATTHSFLLVFTSIGKIHWIKGYKIPEGGRQASGRVIINLLNLEENENITALMPIRRFDEVRRVFMATRRGVAKMVMLSAFSRPMSRGIKAINLDEGDELVAVKPIFGGEQVVIATKKGYAIRFSEDEVRVMGRSARGVRAIRLKDDSDEVVGMEVFSPKNLEEKTKHDQNTENVSIAGETNENVSEKDVDIDSNGKDNNDDKEESVEYEGKLLTVSERGYGKQTDINDYRITHRGGKGVLNIRITPKTGEVLSIKRLFEGDELMLVTTSGRLIRLDAGKLRSTGRVTSGVILIKLDRSDELISVVRIPAQEEKVD